MSKQLFRRQFLYGSVGLGAVPAAGSGPPARTERESSVFPVVKYGAVGDGVRLNTEAIQAAIDACTEAGGGTVYFPAGRYLSGTIYLKSNVTVHLETGAVLVGSKSLKDYPATIPDYRSYTDNYTEKSLIYGENLENIAIEGRGTVDGQGAYFKGPYKVRPYLIRLIQCRNISFSGVTLENSPMWVLHFLACDEVNVDGISIHSRVNRNNDGIDIDCCQRVRISNCEISTGDDAIVLKSTSNRPSRNVTISNCVLSSYCNALKMGTESNGGFQNIAISNCAIYDTRLTGIALEIVDGGAMDHVTVSNITIQKIGTPIFIRLGDRARPFVEGGARPQVGKLRNVLISNVQVTGAGRIGCAVSGIPGHRIENVVLENVKLVFEGGGSRQDAHREIPEYPENYPEHSMFGVLPAYGLYCRHVKDISLRNVVLGFDKTDERPAVVCDDVHGLEVFGGDFSSLSDGEPAVRVTDVKDAFVHGCHLRRAIKTYMQVTGERTERISLIGNDFTRAQKALDAGPEVPRGAVAMGPGKV
jgi:hypothetical protein